MPQSKAQNQLEPLLSLLLLLLLLSLLLLLLLLSLLLHVITGAHKHCGGPSPAP